MDILQQDIMYLTGVGPHRKEILKKELGISTYSDLLEFYIRPRYNVFAGRRS